MAGSWYNVSAPMLSSESLHRPVGETVPTLYPRDFVNFMISMIVMVLCSALMITMYSLSLEMRDISVWSCDFHITGHPKYDTTKPERERAISESYLASSGNQLPPKSASDHKLMLLSQGLIYMTIFSVALKYLPILLTASPCDFLGSLENCAHWCTMYEMSGWLIFSK